MHSSNAKHNRLNLLLCSTTLIIDLAIVFMFNDAVKKFWKNPTIPKPVKLLFYMKHFLSDYQLHQMPWQMP